MLELCEENQIRLTFRLGYSWDNGFRKSTAAQQIALLVDPEQRKRWYEFCRQTYSLASQFHCYAGAFISWEDFWCLTIGPSLPDEERRHWAKYVGYPRDTLPARNNPAMVEFFDFFDNLFANDFFVATKKCVPNLGIEVRMDDDPIFRGDTQISAFVHKKMFAAPDLRDVYLYWGPHMGARNEGDLISAELASNLLLNALRKARNLASPEARLIMAQFNYVDNSPGFDRNSHIAPDQLKDFVNRNSEILRQYCTATYAWSNVSYHHNAVINGTFSGGSSFWEFDDALVRLDDNQPCVTVFPGGSVRQSLDTDTLVCAGLAAPGNVRLEFSAKTISDTDSTVTLGDKSAVVHTWQRQKEWRRYAVDFEAVALVNQSLQISVKNGALIDSLSLANHTQEIGARDKNFSRDVLYADLAWAISRRPMPAISPPCRPPAWKTTNGLLTPPPSPFRSKTVTTGSSLA